MSKKTVVIAVMEKPVLSDVDFQAFTKAMKEETRWKPCRESIEQWERWKRKQDAQARQILQEMPRVAE